MSRGQVIAELALAMPLVLLLLMAGLDGGRLVLQKLDQDMRTDALARWAAEHPDATEDEFSVVVVAVGPCASAERTFGPAPGLVTVRQVCSYSPLGLHGIWDGLRVGSEAVAAIRETP